MASNQPRPRRVDVYRDEADRWRWRQRASNGVITADSGQSYRTRGEAINSAVGTFTSPVDLRVYELDGTVNDMDPIR